MKENRSQRRPARGKKLRFLLPWLLSTILSAGCDLPGRPIADNGSAPPDDASDFDTLYAAHCAGCHGADGRLGPAPPLNDPLFLAIVPDDVLEKVVRQGRHNTLMPAFAKQFGGRLTEQQVQALARGIKSRWRSEQSPSGDLPTYLPPKNPDGTNGGNRAGGAHAAENAADARPARATEAFSRACADCHGEHGEGGGDGGAINSPDFLQLISDQALRRYVITGRPDLGMPDYAQGDGRPSDFQPLTNQDIDDLVSLLAEWRAERSSPGAPGTNEESASIPADTR